MYTLALGPDRCANSYGGCIVNGLRFHTKDHDYGQTIQNSGIMVSGFHGKDKVNFYGELHDVLELQYKSKRVLLFKCEWFDTNFRKGNTRNEKGFVSINISKRWYEDQPFILVNEAEQVFYLDDDKFGNDWKVVQFVQPGFLWDIPEIENDEEDHEDQLSEPRDLVIVRTVPVDAESMEFGNLNREDVEPVIVEGDVMEMKLNIFDDLTINKEFSEDDPEDDDSLSGYDSGLFDSLNSNNTDGERSCKLLITFSSSFFFFNNGSSLFVISGSWNLVTVTYNSIVDKRLTDSCASLKRSPSKYLLISYKFPIVIVLI